jgi:hypothetical protein
MQHSLDFRCCNFLMSDAMPSLLLAGSIPTGSENLLASLPRVVREMSIATVQAAAAQAHLEAVQGEAAGLEGAVQTARASLPEEQDAAEEAAKEAAQGAPVDAQVWQNMPPS